MTPTSQKELDSWEQAARMAYRTAFDSLLDHVDQLPSVVVPDGELHLDRLVDTLSVPLGEAVAAHARRCVEFKRRASLPRGKDRTPRQQALWRAGGVEPANHWRQSAVLRGILFGTPSSDGTPDHPEGSGLDESVLREALELEATSDGYRILGASGLPFLLGLRNGHYPRSANGFPLTTLEEARDARRALVDAEQIDLVVARKVGREWIEVTLHIAVL